MTFPPSREHAKEIVERITRDHGYVSEEQLQGLEPGLRGVIRDAFMQKDRMIGSSIVTLSKNLYTSKARFVYELLQNADDNNYTKAHDMPFVRFWVYPKKIVFECNEDGFTEENLKAICAVGQSSKTAAGRYIGEKGIGFKSVFMVAWKVHVQSGHFSFSFTHKPKDNGMGMISPIWETEGEPLPAWPLTRITLYLHDTEGQEGIADIRQAIREQFKELQETFLLFMKNLKRIEVSFISNLEEDQALSALYMLDCPEPNKAKLYRSGSNGTEIKEKTRHFHVTTHEVQGLAKSENRSFSNDESSQSYSKSQIVLGFPLSRASVPLIRPQHLFVFLPVRQSGLKFLVQADFVTDAARQDIIRESPRNLGLIDGVADAFIEAISQFCQHATLAYEWVRYLPDTRTDNQDWFFHHLTQSITGRLEGTPVLKGSRRPDQLRLVSDVLRLEKGALDDEGKPLFDDIQFDRIISPRYTTKAMDCLMGYGLSWASYGQLIIWIKQDLEQGALSRMKSPETMDSWHIRAAKLLVDMLKTYQLDLIIKLKDMDLLPLQDGTWVSASSGPVYFPHADTMEIPQDIGLRLISKNITDQHRRKLFAELGVQEASINLVRTKIFACYRDLDRLSTLSVPASKRHLEFLYVTHHMRSEGSLVCPDIAVFDSKGMLRQPFRNVMYIEHDEPHSPFQLFQPTKPGPNPGDGAPGYTDCNFVNNEYFSSSPMTPQGQALTWEQWFYEVLRVKSIVHMGFGLLSSEGEYIRQHRPERFLVCLARWILAQDIDEDPNIEQLKTGFEHLKRTEVLCRGNRLVPFASAYFPTDVLGNRVSRFLAPNFFFPWLCIDTNELTEAQWKDMLSRLVSHTPITNVAFGLEMVKYSKEAISDDPTPSDKVKLLELYDHISTQIREETPDEARQNESREQVRHLFEKNTLIFVPLSDNRRTWVSPSECVWKAPQQMFSRYTLERLYMADKDVAELDHLARFFTQDLGIEDCGPQTLIDELKALKVFGSDDVSGIYAGLDAMKSRIIGPAKDELRDAFEGDALIYALSDENGAWHRTSQCIWSSAARLRGKVSLNDEYDQFEDLFVNFLGVKRVDLSMAIDELKAIGSEPKATIEELKESIQTVNSLLSGCPLSPNPHDVVACNIFPIRCPDGNVVARSNAMEFFIPDREPLRLLFETKVKFLDFSLEEVVRLRPFLEWTGLDERYLSKYVREMTSFHGNAAKRIFNMERQTRNRAHALLRISNHFNSPRVQGQINQQLLYTILKTVEIYESDGISSDLVLTQGNVTHTVKGRVQTLHIAQSHDRLRVYIPQNKDDQDYISTRSLPEKLFKWMMEDPATHIPDTFYNLIPRRSNNEHILKDGVAATRDIILAPRSRLDRALDDNGIAMVNIENTDDEATSDLDSITLPLRVIGDDHEAAASDSDLPEIVAPGFSAWPTQRYIALLDKVIKLGRRHALPKKSHLHRDLLFSSRSRGGDSTGWGLNSLPQMERDFRVGAAGELYVFELLSHLTEPCSLPDFGINNWQSNMREYVKVHPEYATIEPWNGYETSDLVYEDSSGALTACLIDLGYLKSELQTIKRQNYFLEVKTTTSSCDTPLYMSKAQYMRMQRNSSDIYIILRVYNLGEDNMGVKTYVHPEGQGLSDDLEFTPESWSAVPRKR